MAVVTQAMQDNVTELYIAFFGRAPDASGFSFWTNAMAGGMTPQQIANVMMDSPEFSSQYKGLTPGQQVDKIYLNVLNRDATTDPTGKAFWVNALNSGVSVGQVAWSVVNSAWEQGTATADGKLVHNKVSVGEYFALTLASNDTAVAATAYKVNGVPVVTSDASSVATAEAALTTAVNAGATFTLTTNADNIVGTDKNDTINGYIETTLNSTTSTFQVIDSINGGGGVNTFNLTVAGANTGVLVNAALTSANVQNVQVLDVRNQAVGTTVNGSLVGGLTDVVADRSTQAIAFTGLAAGVGVGVKGAQSAAATTTATYAAAGAAKIVLDGATGGQNITVTNNSTSATINGKFGAAASTVGTVDLSGGATVTALTVNAESGVTATLVAGDYTATSTLTVTGGGAVNLTGFGGNVINAAANSGGLTITAAASTKTITGGTGADVITLGGALTATGTVDLAAGNDTLLAAAGNLVAATNVVDGGTGTDTLALLATSLANASAFKNFEVLNVDGLAAATYDVSLLSGSNTFTSLTANATDAAAATISNVAAGVGLTAIGAAAITNYTIVQTGASTGTADSFNVSFAATGTAAEAQTVGLTLNNIETINVASGGGTGDTNTFNLTSTVLNGATVAAPLTETVVITGANQLTTNVSAAVAALAGSVKVVVNASAATGIQLIIGGSTTTSITGGSAADTLTVAATSNTTLSGGAGNDTFVADADVIVSATVVDYVTTISSAAAGDIVSFAVSGGTSTAGAIGAATSIAGSTDLYSALALLEAAADTSTQDLAWAVIAGNTYIVSDAGGPGSLAGSNVVALTGTYNLATSTVDAAGNLTLV